MLRDGMKDWIENKKENARQTDTDDVMTDRVVVFAMEVLGMSKYIKASEKEAEKKVNAGGWTKASADALLDAAANARKFLDYEFAEEDRDRDRKSEIKDRLSGPDPASYEFI